MFKCAGAAQYSLGSPPDSDIKAVRDASVSYLLRPGGARDFESFRAAIVSDHGEVFSQYTNAFYREARRAYNEVAKKEPSKYAPIPPRIEDYIPDYNGFNGGDGYHAAMSDMVKEMAKDGMLSELRRVNPGEENRSIKTTVAGATRVLKGMNAEPTNALSFQREYGLTPDEAAYAVDALAASMTKEVIRAERAFNLADAELAKQKTLDPNLSTTEARDALGAWVAAKERSDAMFAMAEVQRGYAVQNHTDVARAMRIFQELVTTRKLGTRIGKEYVGVFGNGPSSAPTDPTLDPKAAASAAVTATNSVLGPHSNATTPAAPKTADSTLVNTADIEGLRKRLAETYVAGKMNPATEAVLREIGMKIKAVNTPDGDFTDWVKALTQETGLRIAPDDLVMTYQSLRQHAFTKVRKSVSVQEQMVRAANNTIDAQYRDEALKEIRAIDPNSPDAAKKYEDIMRAYRLKSPVVWWKDLPNLYRAVRTSFDMSAPWRQASVITLGWGLNPLAFTPTELAKSYGKPFYDKVVDAKTRQRIVTSAFADMVAAKSDAFEGIAKTLGSKKAGMKSPEFAHYVMQEINSRANAPMYAESGLAMTSLGVDGASLTTREEAFMTNLTEKWAESGNWFQKRIAGGISSSEAAYAVYLNRIRADAFDHLTSLYSADGYTIATDPALYKATADYINDMTGRSAIPGDERGASAKLLASTFFSARFQISRAKILAMAPRAIASEAAAAYEKSGRKLPEAASWVGEKTNSTTMERKLREQVYGDMTRLVSAYGAVASLAMLAGANVDLDPRSSDFLLLRFGNTRVDVLGGLRGWITMFARVGTGDSVDKNTRLTTKAGGNVGVESIVDNFIRSKLAPVPGMVGDFVAGENIVGEPVYPSLHMKGEWTPEKKKKLAEQVFFNLTPMQVKDVADAIRESKPEDRARAIFLASLAYIGVGAMTYDQNKKRPPSEPDTAAPKKALPVLGRK